MPHPPWEDLGVFFNPNDFATKAIITRDGEIIAEVFGIFDDPTEVADLGEYDMDHATPRFTCPEIEVGALQALDVVTIEGKAFDLMETPQLDGTGIAVLVLGTPNVAYNAGI